VMQEDAVRYHYEGVWSLLGDCVEGLIAVRILSHPDKLQVNVQHLGRRASLLLRRRVERIVGIQEERYVRDFRNDLPEQFQSLSLQVRRNRGQSSEISTRPSEARDKTRSDRIANGRHDEGTSPHRSLDR